MSNSVVAPMEEADLHAAERLTQSYRQMSEQLSRVIVGQRDVLKQVMIALFCQGHCILEGVPGLAKTLMIANIAQLLSLNFKRIQFTPDLMPSDITGTEILEEEEGTGHRRMKFVKGPIFGNIILGDEINRTPPKTQAALLQAMQEYKVTISGVDHHLEKPFLVLGTQNPIEQEGTYPLPEAQLDRFMFKIIVDYPTFDEELMIAETTTSGDAPKLQPVVTKEVILQMQRVVRKVLVGRSMSSYAVQLVRSTRPGSDEAPDFVKKYLTWGAGPRACQAILLGAKANAMLDGRINVSFDDIRAVTKPVLRHRLGTSFRAESDGVTADHIVEKLFEVIREPR
ncbi:AAA family ATPase [Tuwongella immobilis]|uniref:AAA+ ATPase domain-containing protein n=1 Tax=Tuwongella immobilis TaxID=692036 RepID=A0A6C2YJ41_9BACT|nr:MoxR family ATPase [Tuwongella immobilis]VIP01426.1 atpase aaa : MoxR protein OS=Hyalangium minutum GN=DB31_6794 PE=4 SV=1: AAA_3 [Tuwongella immobilis]VTR98370.1 atpase aaa : MoxR protein OS=Hyalangium minutum GN=DB31_6794 PE=4 SV=1: AAA_3 [Tuwongella immobilis]